jgi:Trk K+ transport system NAD-binding subunit
MALSHRRPQISVWRARLHFVGYALKLLAPRIALLSGVTLGGGLFYRARLLALGQKAPDVVAASYEVYTQLFFEHGEKLPADPALRALFFGIPLVGALLLAEGLFKLGASLLDFRSHREQWMRIMARTQQAHVILIGLGHIGFRVLEELLEREVPVVVIEQNGDSAFADEARAQGVPVVVGDARRNSLLAEANIEKARAVIACTDDDLVNLEVAIDARNLNPECNLVMRMFEQAVARKIGTAFALDSSFSTSALSAPAFAAAALDEHVHGAYRLGDTMMVSIEMPIRKDGPLDGKTVDAIEAALKAPVVGIHRSAAKPTHRFARTETLRDGDAVICHVPADQADEVRSRAGRGGASMGA